MIPLHALQNRWHANAQHVSLSARKWPFAVLWKHLFMLCVSPLNTWILWIPSFVWSNHDCNFSNWWQEELPLVWFFCNNILLTRAFPFTNEYNLNRRPTPCYDRRLCLPPDNDRSKMLLQYTGQSDPEESTSIHFWNNFSQRSLRVWIFSTQWLISDEILHAHLFKLQIMIRDTIQQLSLKPCWLSRMVWRLYIQVDTKIIISLSPLRQVNIIKGQTHTHWPVNESCEC